MKTTNVTTLRTRLSQILDAVRRGEEVEILDRSVPIARLVPVRPDTTPGHKGLPPWLERLRRAGVVRVGNLKPVPEILRGFSSGAGPMGEGPLGRRAVQAILDERRAGR